VQLNGAVRRGVCFCPHTCNCAGVLIAMQPATLLLEAYTGCCCCRRPSRASLAFILLRGTLAYVMQLLLLLSPPEEIESGLPGLPEPVQLTLWYADLPNATAAAAVTTGRGWVGLAWRPRASPTYTLLRGLCYATATAAAVIT
jgi:hypothetical protein